MKLFFSSGIMYFNYLILIIFHFLMSFFPLSHFLSSYSHLYQGFNLTKFRKIIKKSKQARKKNFIFLDTYESYLIESSICCVSVCVYNRVIFGISIGENQSNQDNKQTTKLVCITSCITKTNFFSLKKQNDSSKMFIEFNVFKKNKLNF